MRRIVATAALLSLTPVAAHAAPHEASTSSPRLDRQYLTAFDKADRRGDPGRNIVTEGIARAGADRPATRDEVRRSLVVLRRMNGTVTVAGGGSASPALEAIAACESGGDPTAVDASGTYRGKYQFDQQTWESVGGSGDPAAAPEAEQDARAQALIAQRGSSPWPNCG